LRAKKLPELWKRCGTRAFNTTACVIIHFSKVTDTMCIKYLIFIKKSLWDLLVQILDIHIFYVCNNFKRNPKIDDPSCRKYGSYIKVTCLNSRLATS